MRETWLSTNRRAILFGCLPPLVIAAAGAWLTFGSLSAENAHPWRWVGIVLIGIGLTTIAGLLRQLSRPRVAFDDAHVLFYLRSGKPIAVPVDIVEAFFAGQGPAHLPVVPKQPQAVNIIARLARRHTEWAERTVKPALGKWSDSYVTIRGSWCEPLDGETIRRLNRRLKEVKDELSRPTPDA